MVLSEKEIIESLHDEGMVNCLLCNQTAFEKRIGSAIFKSWKKWIDTSAHNAPPPDFFSDKLKMMLGIDLTHPKCALRFRRSLLRSGASTIFCSQLLHGCGQLNRAGHLFLSLISGSLECFSSFS